MLRWAEFYPGLRLPIWSKQLGDNPKPKAPPHVVKRIRQLEMVQETPKGKKREKIVQSMIEVWEEAEADGVLVEWEAEYEEASE